MNVYLCEGYHTENWHERDDDFDVTEVVVANTEREALGFCLDSYRSSKAGWWELTKVDTEKIGFVEER